MKGGYSTLNKEQGQWIQIDLGDITKVEKIGTQGRGDLSQWVTQYKLSYSYDGGYFEFYKQQPYNVERVSLQLKKPNLNGFCSFISWILFTTWEKNFGSEAKPLLQGWTSAWTEEAYFFWTWMRTIDKTSETMALAAQNISKWHTRAYKGGYTIN